MLLEEDADGTLMERESTMTRFSRWLLRIAKKSYHFNQELLKMFQQRRQNEAAKRGEGLDSEGMIQEKKRPFQCLDEFNALDDEEEDEHARSSLQYLKLDPVNHVPSVNRFYAIAVRFCVKAP